MPDDFRKKLLASAEELDVVSILAALRPLAVWELTDKQDSNWRENCEARRMVVRKKSWADGYDLTKEEHIKKMIKEAKLEPP